MIQVQLPGRVAAEPIAPPVKRISPRVFLMLCVFQGAIIAGVLGFVLFGLAPQRVPLARSGDYVTVHEAILARMNGSIADPLVELAPGVSARESNVRGFTLHGQTFYYYFEGQPGFDPLSRGRVDASKIEIVARDENLAHPLVIYRLVEN
jgi:hypothetical protein